MKSLTESILDGFKIRKQITELQGVVEDEYERLLDENPKKYHSGKQLLSDVFKFAKEKYDEIVTMENALDFDSWWREYEKANSNFLDATIFRN